MESPAPTIDPRSGYCAQTRTFHSLLPKVELPPTSQPLSVTSFAFSLLPTPFPTNKAFIDASNESSLSFEDLHSRVLSLSSSLLHTFPRLLSKGQVAFILTPTSLDVPVLYLSLLSIGVVVSPSNPTCTPHEISQQITLSKPSLAFATSSTAHLLPPDTPTLLLDSPRYHSLLQHHQPPTTTHISVKQTDTAAVLYSSGTTGPTKAVALSHRNFIKTMAAAHAGNAMVFFLSRPLYHMYGFVVVMSTVALGSTAVMIGGERRLEMEELLRAVERHRVACIPLAPTLLEEMARLPDTEVQPFDLSSLRLAFTSGASLRRELKEAFVRRFPTVALLQAYGMTETAGAAAAGMKGSQSQENNLYESVGRLSSNMEAKIVDPINGEALPPGKQGELWLRGPTIMQGYLHDEVATENALHPEGWLKTGDLSYLDDDGYLFVLERLNQVIKYKTHQVFPTELEHVLHSHPEIADVAVVPYPDKEAGDIPMAYVVREDGSKVSQEQIIKFVANKVDPYKRIHRVEFIDVIPKSSAGKILRRELLNGAP